MTEEVKMKKRALPGACLAAVFAAASALAARPDYWKPNYDKSKIAPYTLEDPLAFADGTKVASPADWARRRREILGIFAREMFGEEPSAPEAVVVEKVEEGVTLAGFGIRRQYRMWFKENRRGPFIGWLVVIPNRLNGNGPVIKNGKVVCENNEKVPVILMLNYRGNQEYDSDPSVPLMRMVRRSSSDLSMLPIMTAAVSVRPSAAVAVRESP